MALGVEVNSAFTDVDSSRHVAMPFHFLLRCSFLTALLPTLVSEKWAVERELEVARHELDAIDSSRESAEKKLQSLMRKCGVTELTSAKGGSITACADEEDTVDGREIDESTDEFM